ncbi:putative FBD domain, leucine-rich repeat domain superfamily [Helianthus annuus]|nr:putative FBD domain, leucine-rich repeat domain superfamily [Helianthus annuus]
MEDESSPVNLPRLKTLDMVAYTNPFVNVFKLINSCPVLESLSLEITMCKYKKDFMFIIPTLKRLKLSFIKHASVLNKIVLNVPNLEYLFVHGVLSSSFVMEDVSSLVEASISCTQMRNRQLWFELLKGINGVQSLSAKNVISNIDFKIPLSSPPLVFPNMKHLELKDVCQYGQISHFLERCPGLKHLRIGQVVEPFLKRTRSSWIEPKFVPACMLTNLTSIKFSNCNGQKPEIQFLEYMLGKAEALKTVTITWENLCTEKEMNLCRHLLKVPRASLYCENHFLENHSLHLL